MDQKPDNLGRQVYDLVLSRLRRGEIAPGQKVVDVSLAEELGISRMPVREALTRLTYEGYLVGTTRGFALAEITLPDAEEIFEMRKLLEPRAVATAARRLTPEALAGMDLILTRAEAGLTDIEIAAFTDAVRAFREVWLQYVPNRRLADAVHRTIAQTDQIQRRSLLHRPARLIVFKSMTELLAAFRDCDPLRANDIVASLIERGREVFAQILGSTELTTFEPAVMISSNRA